MKSNKKHSISIMFLAICFVVGLGCKFFTPTRFTSTPLSPTFMSPTFMSPISSAPTDATLTDIPTLASVETGVTEIPTPASIETDVTETPAAVPATVEPLPAQTATTNLPNDPANPPIIPIITAADKERLRIIYLAGQAAGNHAAVFAKVGDSMTWLSFFLKDEIGCGVDRMDRYDYLLPTVEYLRATAFPADYTDVWCGVANAYTRSSVTAVHSWTSADALDPARLDPVPFDCSAPYDTPLKCELHLIKPSIALIMYGTNDLFFFNDLEMFRANLTQIVADVLNAGVIPVLSTIPPRFDTPEWGARVPMYNQIIIEVAQVQRVPLWNYWLALQDLTLVNHGIGADGVHPNYSLDGAGGDYGAAIFTPEGLRYGFNLRNLTAIQVLDKLKRVVIDDGAPD